MKGVGVKDAGLAVAEGAVSDPDRTGGITLFALIARFEPPTGRVRILRGDATPRPAQRLVAMGLAPPLRIVQPFAGPPPEPPSAPTAAIPRDVPVIPARHPPSAPIRA